KAWPQNPECHQPADIAIREHEAQAIFRISRIERQVRAAGFQHREHRHNHIYRALETNSDQTFPADIRVAQLTSELIRTRIEFRVSQRLRFMFYRHGLRRLRRLRLETPVNWPIIQQPRIVRIPIDDERVMLVFSQHVQAGDWLVESRDHALKNSPEIAQHPPDRLVIEAAAVIDDAHL